MIRGGCQSFKFTLPCIWSNISGVRILFWQEGNDAATVEITQKNDCKCKQDIPELNENEIIVTLNQTQTLAFWDDRKAYVQIKVMKNDGVAIPTTPISIMVYPTKIETVLPVPAVGGD